MAGNGLGAPIFVVGCPRSGTTLLHHMLASSGRFANYRAETHLFDEVLPRFGNLASPGRRERLLAHWLKSPRFTVSGIDPDRFAERVRTGCRTMGDFLRLFMESILEAQGVGRWVESTPGHVLHMRQIKRAIPDARFLHIIRDGRDVALSLRKLGWVRPLPWDRARALEVAAWTWSWLVDAGRRQAATLGPDYLEVHFEELVRDPRAMLARVGRFVGESLDLDRIRAAAIGSVGAPNTAFERSSEGADFDPIGRWRTAMLTHELARVEACIGEQLRGLGYELGAHQTQAPLSRLRQSVYRSYRSVRLALKLYTPLGRLLSRPAWDQL